MGGMGFTPIYMLTGDHPDVAELVGDVVGVDLVCAERTPAEKLEVVGQGRRQGPTLMLGDGVNDAPALAAADVGIAMGARGVTAASEVADGVLTNDRLDDLATAVRIARRTMAIARQSVWIGMAVSILAMGPAIAGWLPPIAGAILQEVLDLAVLANALRALGGGPTVRRIPAADRLGHEMAASHAALRPKIDDLSGLANALEDMDPPDARGALADARAFLLDDLLPHERAEQATVYPVLAHLLPGEDPTGPLIRTHQEIARLTRLFARLVERLPAYGPQAADLRDLRRILVGLHAILQLHFDQEEDLYALLSPAAWVPP